MKPGRFVMKCLLPLLGLILILNTAIEAKKKTKNTDMKKASKLIQLSHTPPSGNIFIEEIPNATQEALAPKNLTVTKKYLNDSVNQNTYMNSLIVMPSTGLSSMSYRGLGSAYTRLIWNGVNSIDSMSPNGMAYLNFVPSLLQHEIIKKSPSLLYLDSLAPIELNTKMKTSFFKVKLADQYSELFANVYTKICDTEIQFSVADGHDHRFSSYKGGKEADKKTLRHYDLNVEYPIQNNQLSFGYSSQLLNLDLDDSTKDTSGYQLLGHQQSFQFSDQITHDEQGFSKLSYSFQELSRHYDRTSSQELSDAGNYYGKNDMFCYDYERYVIPNCLLKSGVYYTVESGRYIDPYSELSTHTQGIMHYGLGIEYENGNQKNIILGKLQNLNQRTFGSYRLETTRSFFDVNGNQFKVIGAYTGGARIPSLYERYTTFDDYLKQNFMNTTLKEELSSTFEFTVAQLWKTMSIETTFFHTQIKDKVVYENKQYENSKGLFKAFGIEQESKFSHFFGLDWMSVSLMYTFAQSVTPTETGNKVESPLKTPEKQLQIKAVKTWQQHTFSWSMVSRSSVKDYADRTVDAFAIQNAYWDYDFNNAQRLSFFIENLFNLDYQEIYGYQAPQRTIGLAYHQSFE